MGIKLKKVLIIVINLIIIYSIPTFCYSSDIKSSLGELDSYGVVSESPEFLNKMGTVVGAIQVVGTFIAVIALIVMGIKYMMGSVEEKAEYKKSLMPYFIGAMLVFGISNILAVVYKIGINLA